MPGSGRPPCQQAGAETGLGGSQVVPGCGGREGGRREHRGLSQPCVWERDRNSQCCTRPGARGQVAATCPAPLCRAGWRRGTRGAPGTAVRFIFVLSQQLSWLRGLPFHPALSLGCCTGSTLCFCLGLGLVRLPSQLSLGSTHAMGQAWEPQRSGATPTAPAGVHALSQRAGEQPWLGTELAHKAPRCRGSISWNGSRLETITRQL